MRNLFAIIFCTAALTASAQDDFNRVRLEFNPSTMSYHGENSDLGKISFAGGSIGYEHGFALSDDYYCYLLGGAKLQYLYKQKTRPYRNPYKAGEFIDTRLTNRALDIYVPVSFMYHFVISDNLAIEPYIGVNATYYLLGKERIELAGYYDETINIFDKSDVQEYGWEEAYKPFQFGWHAGADLVLSNSCSVGLSYGTDFTDFGNDAHWTHWSLGFSVSF